MLAGNLAAIGVGGIVSVVWSYIVSLSRIASLGMVSDSIIIAASAQTTSPLMSLVLSTPQLTHMVLLLPNPAPTPRGKTRRKTRT